MPPRNVLVEDAGGTPPLGFAEFRAALRGWLAEPRRLLTWFAAPRDGDVLALHALAIGPHGLEALHARGRVDEPFPALTPEFPALHCFEREIHEQTGLPFPGHPWLKPIRFEGRARDALDSYPFYRLDGQEVHEVGVGPIHAGVIEPGHFRFMCAGETVHHLEIHLGYQHRGAERLLRTVPAKRVAPLVESLAGDTAVAHVVAYCRAWEALCGAPAAPEVESVRALAVELERIAMHLVGVGGLATDVAFLPGSSTYGRLRTAIINVTMRMCGSRFGRGWFRPGQLRWAFGAAQKDDLRKTLADFQRDLAAINRLFRRSWTVRHRLETTGAVPTAAARSLGLVGMAARASGVPCDLRTELPAPAYAARPLALLTEPAGDCQARAEVRLREIDASVAWIRAELDAVPDLAAEPPARLAPQPGRRAYSAEEGWRGEILHCLETGAEGRVVWHKAQDPSLRNWFGLAQAVRGNAIYDFPICNKSFDLSYCGNDL